MDRREGARILRETVALLEALEQDFCDLPVKYLHIDRALLDGLFSKRWALEGVAERLAEDEARESEAKR